LTAPVDDDPRLKPLPMVAAWLAQRHADDQELVADNLVLGLFPLWQLMRFDDLDASTAVWLESVMPRVETAYLQSQRLAAVFTAYVRAAELPTDPPLLIDVPEVQFSPYIRADSFEMPPLVEKPIRPPLPDVELVQEVVEEVSDVVPEPAPLPDLPPDVVAQLERGRRLGTPQFVLDRIEFLARRQQGIDVQEFPRRDVATSLTIEANYATKRAMPGPEERLMRDALTRSSGAAVRQAMNGGRGVIDLAAAQDEKIKGYARVTDGDPCAFCALLASRGAVYGKGSFINTDRQVEEARQSGEWSLNPDAARDVPAGWSNVAKVHNNCRCHLRPVYSTESTWDAAGEHFKAVWYSRGDYINSEDTLELVDKLKRRNPDIKGYEIQRAVDLLAFKRALAANPFQGNQFDLAQMRDDLRGRRAGLLDAGFDPTSPQVAAAERMLERIS